MKDHFKDFVFPSEREINEDTRRAKISRTTRIKMETDPAFRRPLRGQEEEAQ